MKQHLFPEEALKGCKPADMGLTYLSVQRLIVSKEVTIRSDTEEICLFVLEGAVAYARDGETGEALHSDLLYLPVGETLRLTGENAVVMRFGAPCSRKTGFSHIRFADAWRDERHKIYGKTEDGTRRDVINLIDESFDSSRFLVGVCHGAKGGWTAWPPHIHGDKREELYVYYDMGDGFGLQSVYRDMEHPDGLALVQNGHIVAIPDGYHPNVGCPKTGIRYVYCMVSVKAEDRAFMDLKTQSIYGDKLE